MAKNKEALELTPDLTIKRHYHATLLLPHPFIFQSAVCFISRMRPTDQRPLVQNEFAQSIRPSQALELLKRRLRPWLERLGTQDPPHPPHRPRDYRTRSFLLAVEIRESVRSGLLKRQEALRRRPSPPVPASAAASQSARSADDQVCFLRHYHIRHKIKAATGRDMICNVRGVGFTFAE